MPPDRSLLLVDDDALLLDSLVRVLRLRFLVRTATTPGRALEMLRAAPNEFFAVVSDVRMPEMDGPSFLLRANRIVPHARMILMSGSIEAEDLVRAVNGPGVFRVILKPVAPPRLIAALEEARLAFEGETATARAG